MKFDEACASDISIDGFNPEHPNQKKMIEQK